MNRLIWVLMLLIGTGMGARAQVTSPARANWWGNTPGMLERQMEHTLEAVSQVLGENPPGLSEPASRRLALLALDNILHDTAADHSAALHRFFHQRMGEAARQITETKVVKGARIWKLYNHGFVVKTPSATMAFDLAGGGSAGIDGFGMPDSVMRQLAAACDVLFVSHFHRDHADRRVAGAFIGAGKPVVAPPGLWEDWKGVLHLQRDEQKKHALKLKGRDALQVIAWPGHQGRDVLNTIYLVTTPEGLRFAHTGDQANASDLLKLEGPAGPGPVDALFVNCWTGSIARLVKAFDPKILISGHENELGHSIDHREPYWLSRERLQIPGYPNVLMTWGEWVSAFDL